MHNFTFASSMKQVGTVKSRFYPKILDNSPARDGSDLVGIPRLSCPGCGRMYGLGDYIAELKAGIPSEELAEMIRCGGIKDKDFYDRPRKRTYKPERLMTPKEKEQLEARIQAYTVRKWLKPDSVKRTAESTIITLYVPMCPWEDKIKMPEWNSQRCKDICAAERVRLLSDEKWAKARRRSSQGLVDFKKKLDADLLIEKQEIFKKGNI